MLTVLGRRNSVNVQKVMWTIGELGLAYERVNVGGSFGYPDSYATLNPNAFVPTLQDASLTLWESNTCVRYLARTYGQDSLWPAATAKGSDRCARAEQWMDWQGGTLMPAFFLVFFNTIRRPAGQADAAAVAEGEDRTAAAYQILDHALADSPYLAGDTFSMADIPAGAMTYRYMTMDINRPELPNVTRWYQSLCARPAYQRHVMIEFGRNNEEWLQLEKAGADVQ